MPDDTGAAAKFIYSEICEVLQAGLTERHEEHNGILRGMKNYYEEHKQLSPGQIQYAQSILGDYEGRNKQQKLF